MLLTHTQFIQNPTILFVARFCILSNLDKSTRNVNNNRRSTTEPLEKFKTNDVPRNTGPYKRLEIVKGLPLALKIEVLEVHGVSVDCNTLLSKDPVTD